MLSKLFPKLRSALVCIIPLLAAALPAQTTINVGPGQAYTTIQSGIDAASNGDTVLVAPGTYYENIDFKGKAITVTSSGGAVKTIIDGGSKGGQATVVFVNGETSSSVISNFTIRGGGDAIFAGVSDGGVFVSGASPTIEANTVTANYCHNIDVEFGTATIIKNEISGVLQDPQGTQGESYCTFGSGIHLQGTYSPDGQRTTIVGNIIENNLTGSGVNLWAAQNVLILDNTIRNNTSPDPGSAFISVNDGGTVLVQNLIYDNNSNCGGAIGFMEAGESAASPTILIANNTIADNVSTTLAGDSNCTQISQIYPGPYAYGTSGPGAVILNNIISGSTPYPAVNCSWFDPPSLTIQPTFENDILYNTGGPFFGAYCVDVSGEDNNIVADPQFVSPSTEDYHLKSTSPAIDSGQNNVLQTFLTMTNASLTTDFDGNPRVQNATGKGCIIDMGAYESPGTEGACSTTETLMSSVNPSSYGQSVAFTATLSSANGVPTGDVQFSDGSTVLGTEVVSGTGAATFNTGQLTVGSHTITAAYQPTGSFPAATATLTQVVSGDTTTTALTCSPGSISIGGTALLTAMVTSADSTPTGSVSFADDGAALATQSLLNGATSLNYTAVTAGTHSVTATYVPTGAFAGSSTSCSEEVTTLPTNSVLTVTQSATTYGSAVTLTAAVVPATPPGVGTPTGTVTFFTGSTALGTGTLTNGVASLVLNTLPGGSDAVTCVYGGSSSYAGSDCNTVSVAISAMPTSTGLTLTPNPAYFGQPVTMTVTVGVQTAMAPMSGSVTFFDGSTQIGNATVGTSGTATFTTSALAVGTHSITATFTPANADFAASTSAVVNEQILASGFTIALSPTTLTLPPGSSGTVAIQLKSVGNFAGPLTLSYGTLPANATASISPTTVTLTAGGTNSATLTLSTVLRASEAKRDEPGSRKLPAVFTAIVLLFAPLSFSRRRKLARLFSVALLLVALQTMTGCTNIWYTDSLVSIGTYQLPVTATDINHNSQSSMLTLVVAPSS